MASDPGSGAPAPLVGATPERALGVWFDAIDAARDAAGAAVTLDTETLVVASALGRVLAQDLVARHANPPHRCAAMDGIAVRAADIVGVPQTLNAGEFAAIDTGEHVQERWDAVVPREEIEWIVAPSPGGRVEHANRSGLDVRSVGEGIGSIEEGSSGGRVEHATPSGHHAASAAEGVGSKEEISPGVRVLYETEPGRHIRPEGEDVPAGAVIRQAGARLGPADLALAVATGHATVTVCARPRIAIQPTGDEVRPAGSELAPGEIPDSNSVLVAAMLTEAGGDPTVAEHVVDDPSTLQRAVAAAAEESDLVLLLAGSAHGRRDHSAAVLEALGSLVVRGVALRPTHPVLLAVVGATPVIGVPGYPVSAAITCERFAIPLLERLEGSAAPARRQVEAVLGKAILGRRDAELVVPVALERQRVEELPVASPLSRRGGALHAYARADATLTVAPEAPPLEAGARVWITLR